MWFKELTGFAEESPEQVRKNLVLEGENISSNVTGKTFACGSLTLPNLGELTEALKTIEQPVGKLTLSEIVADVQELHRDKANAGSLFQVASQFNLLEMVSPEVSPEAGIDGYEYDHTQGPACAIAAGAGTIYRNYFAPVNGHIGQSIDYQINALYDISVALGNESGSLWKMKNGYALVSEKGLNSVAEKIMNKSESEIDKLRQLLRIGLQQNTEVTISDSKHKITQAYCSALPVAYSHYSTELWKPFATLVLQASYEATLCAAIINTVKTGNNKVFLTLLGGGAFGNKTSWIINAIERALTKHKNTNIDVFIVSYGSSNHKVKALVEAFK